MGTRDTKEEGGRPHYDEVLMVKMLVLQGWYGLSDYEAERQATDRISFQHFLGYPGKGPTGYNALAVSGTADGKKERST